jgi:hypothetical protein
MHQIFMSKAFVDHDIDSFTFYDNIGKSYAQVLVRHDSICALHCIHCSTFHFMFILCV